MLILVSPPASEVGNDYLVHANQIKADGESLDPSNWAHIPPQPNGGVPNNGTMLGGYNMQLIVLILKYIIYTVTICELVEGHTHKCWTGRRKPYESA